MRNRLKGITLIETVVYIAIFSIIIFMILNFMLTTQESTQRTERRAMLYKTSQFLVQHLEDSFDSVINIDTNNSIFNSNQGVLEMIYDTESKQYYISDSTMYYNGIAISPDSVNVSSFNIEPVYQENTEVIGVRVNIDLVSPKDTSVAENINMLFTIR